MTEWTSLWLIVFLSLRVGALGAIAARVVSSLERTARAVERLAEATRLPGEG